MYNHIYKKKLCMTELDIVQMHFDDSQYFDVEGQREFSAFLYINRGHVTIHTTGCQISAGEGELLFLPEGIRYRASWRGTPEIDYYSLRIISKQVGISASVRLALQKVIFPDSISVGERIREIYRLFETTERISMLYGLGLYYEMYAQLLPCLREADVMTYSAAIHAATAYIDQYYAEDFSIEKLAAHCRISESRLYHLFREELDTTPIRYRNTVRIEYAAADLRIAGLTIDEVAEKNGFHSAAYFRETFKEETGLTPTEYRRMARRSEA